MGELVLSLFPGIGLLDRAFEEAGYCIVRGPDAIWGGDIRNFSPPAERFDGVIGGPPCQMFSRLAFLQRHQGREPRFGNLIPEFERCVAEAQPAWFLMENVSAAPLPVVDGYQVDAHLLNNRRCVDDDGIGAAQNRVRRFCYGHRPGTPDLDVQLCALESPLIAGVLAEHAPTPGQRALNRPYAPQAVLASTRAVPVRIGGSGKVKATAPGAVTSSDGGPSARMTRYTLAEACLLQGLPGDFLDEAPFTAAGKLKAIANGVPLPMGRAIAQAVRRATAHQEISA